jgi:hypothetical protein
VRRALVPDRVESEAQPSKGAAIGHTSGNGRCTLGSDVIAAKVEPLEGGGHPKRQPYRPCPLVADAVALGTELPQGASGHEPSAMALTVASRWLLTQGYTNTILVDCLVLIINSHTWSRVPVLECDLALETLWSLGPVRLA